MKIKKTESLPTTQDLIPITDIEDSIIYRKDNRIVVLLRINAINISLMSDNEKGLLCSALSEATNSIDYHYQYYCCERPIDLNQYVEELGSLNSIDKNVHQRNLISYYLNEAMQLSSSGEAREKRFYLLIDADGNKKNSEHDLLVQAENLIQDIKGAKIDCYLCRDKEIMEVYTLFTRPHTTDLNISYDRADLPMFIKKDALKGDSK